MQPDDQLAIDLILLFVFCEHTPAKDYYKKSYTEVEFVRMHRFSTKHHFNYTGLSCDPTNRIWMKYVNDCYVYQVVSNATNLHFFGVFLALAYIWVDDSPRRPV